MIELFNMSPTVANLLVGYGLGTIIAQIGTLVYVTVQTHRLTKRLAEQRKADIEAATARLQEVSERYAHLFENTQKDA